jgi:hypothetical protein
LKVGGELSFVATQDLPDFHPRTVLWDWENGEAFHLTDALTSRPKRERWQPPRPKLNNFSTYSLSASPLALISDSLNELLNRAHMENLSELAV